MPANRLAHEPSPYLRQHQHNPVNWYPWGEEAFAAARGESKPIFLSIGYSTCHWCHVMERESFEDPATAEILNAGFVSIKVDREERPDVDKIYMSFVQATSGQGGWPLNVFLTPELKPFYGGTYFPPDQRHGRPAFRQILQQIASLWQTRKSELEQSAHNLHAQLERFADRGTTSGSIQFAPSLHQAAQKFKAEFDPRHGGFGGAPKFPRPSQPLFLLTYHARFGDPEALRMVIDTCHAMDAGGIHDHLGGGFARYSVDAGWRVPHFEKMLYDNAQLAQLYLEAYLADGDARLAHTVHDILGYVLRDMTHAEGGFFSAEDADSEGHEGKFYCWTRSELAALLSPEELALATRAFGITEAGNFVDHSHPQPLLHQNVLSMADPHLSEGDRALLASIKARLLRTRHQRVRPQRDDKILTSWNGLMLGAFARAYAVLGDSRYRVAAERNARFLHTHLWDPQTRTLYHRWHDGERDSVQLLNAYAFLLSGLLDLYEATLDASHLEWAQSIADAMIQRFHDPASGGFWQSPDSPDLILRCKEDYDGAEPSGNSVAALALLKLSAITGRAELRRVAEQTLLWSAPRLEQLPQAVPCMLMALAFAMEEPYRAVVVGDPSQPETRDLLAACQRVHQPHKVTLGQSGPVEPFARSLPAGPSPRVYLCSGNACQPPVTRPEEVRQAITSGKSMA
ncbi:MAG: thioredoxin domain-containing protein [Verrucomicrobia bacterium]|nr:thioredoxin domain-containing protein [Verrucomicrobiota bacterium]